MNHESGEFWKELSVVNRPNAVDPA